MDKLNQELDAFGARFGTNRLVDLAINQRANAVILEKVHNAVNEDKLEKWLASPPDMKQKQRETEKTRKEGTGRWFFERAEFVEWQDNAGSLWIEGPSGAGKSVLSSAVISKLVEDKKLFRDVNKPPPPPAVAFFYFDFRTKETQSVESALRRIILQLSAQSPYPYKDLDEHYSLSKGQTLPTIKDLHHILQRLLQQLRRTYIILDALDECASEDVRPLFDLVSILRAWTRTPLHLLITSQPRGDFATRLGGVPRIALDLNATQEDIRFFIDCEIQTNPKLEIWRSQAKEIIDRLASKSNGMFRLASCLLIELSRCRWQDQLDDKLDKLPNTLIEIYDRFLGAIPQEDWVYAEALLRWILFSIRPMSSTQLADAISFDFPDPAQYTYKPDRRESNARAIFQWLDGMILVNTDARWPTVKLAHASVQDYLLSKHFITKFGRGLSEGPSHTFITRTCITSLLYFADHASKEAELHSRDEALLKYPFAMYSADHWCQHLIRSHDRAVLFATAMLLLEDGSGRYSAFQRLKNCPRRVPPPPGGAPRLVRLYERDPPSPFKYCCREGYIEGVQSLLPRIADINQTHPHPSALMLASSKGHTDIVGILLDHDADPNLETEQYESALLRASHGHVETVRLLLDKGADPNLRRDRERLSPLQIASLYDYSEVVRLLLKKGADPNVPVVGREPALTLAATFGSHTEIVRLLLENGAHVNTTSPEYGCALSTAAFAGHTEIVRALLENNADVNLQSEGLGYRKETFSLPHAELVHLLLGHADASRDHHSQFGSPLEAASKGGHVEIVRLLLEHGADINLRTKERAYASALEAASTWGHIDIVHLLFQNPTDVEVDIQVGALVCASATGRIDIVRFLLENGVDAHVNLRGSGPVNALTAASGAGEADIVSLLLDKDADVNPLYEKSYSPLAAACRWGGIKIVHLLLENGVDVNGHVQNTGTGLELACQNGNKDIVQLLLKRGAKITNTALRAAKPEILVLLYNTVDSESEGSEWDSDSSAA